MKKLIIATLAFAALAVSCNSGTGNNTSSELGKKMQIRDSLNVQIAQLGASLSEIEAWIAENDTNVTQSLTQITTQEFSLQTYKHFVEVHGTVKAEKNALVYSSMGGKILSIKKPQGSKVSKGQLLVSIDAGALNNNIAQMKTQLHLASDVFERQERLWLKEKIGSELQYLEAKANKESLESGIASLKSQLSNSQIYAPFGGIIDEIFPSVGDMANPSMPVLRIVAPGEASIESDVAEEYLAALHKDDSVDVVLGRGDTLLARIDQVGGFINPGNRTFKITSRLTSGNADLLPNQLLTVRICDMLKDSAYVLSPRLIMEDSKGDSYIYVTSSKEDITRVRRVYISRIRSGRSAVLVHATSELKPGDRIVDQGSRLVVDDQRVRVKKDA